MAKVSNLPGFSKYYISKRGKLYRFSHKGWIKVKPCIKNTGYVSNILWGDDGKKHNMYRHRLVAIAWIENPKNLSQVCHKDNNPLNNRWNNLYWGDAYDNITQCIRDGNFYFVGKTRKKKVNEEDICRDYIRGIPRKEILDKYHISTGILYKILNIREIPFRKPWNSKRKDNGKSKNKGYKESPSRG